MSLEKYSDLRLAAQGVVVNGFLLRHEIKDHQESLLTRLDKPTDRFEMQALTRKLKNNRIPFHVSKDGFGMGKAGLYIDGKLEIPNDLQKILDSYQIETELHSPNNYAVKDIIATLIELKLDSLPELTKIQHREDFRDHKYRFEEDLLVSHGVESSIFSIFNGFAFRIEFIPFDPLEPSKGGNLLLLLNQETHLVPKLSLLDLADSVKDIEGIFDETPFQLRAEESGIEYVETVYLKEIVDREARVTYGGIENKEKWVTLSNLFPLGNVYLYRDLIESIDHNYSNLDRVFGEVTHRFSYDDLTGIRRTKLSDAPIRYLSKIKEIRRSIFHQIFPLQVGGVTYDLSEEQARAEDVGELYKFSDQYFALKFSNGSSRFASSGLRTLGPYEQTRRTILLRMIIPDGYSSESENNLMNGISESLKNIFGASFNFLETERYKKGDVVSVIEKITTSDGSRPEKPIYVVSLIGKKDPDNINSEYYLIKSILLSKGFQSQIIMDITLKNQEDTSMFQYTIQNLSLGIFVKCGGRPWYLNNPIQLSECPQTLIIGTGVTELRSTNSTQSNSRYVGYFTFSGGSGQWISLEPLYSTYDSFADSFQLALRKGLDTAVETVPRCLTIFIHYSGKKIRNTEIEMIKEVIKKFSINKGIKRTNIVILELMLDSKYRLITGLNGGYCDIGTYLDFRNGLVLIYTTGFFGNRSMSVGVNSPILVNLKKLVILEGENNEVNVTDYKKYLPDIVYSIVGLARLNWKTMYHLSKEPATVKYAKDMVYTMAHLAKFGDVNNMEGLKEDLWFI